jgi:hypothetical protein
LEEAKFDLRIKVGINPSKHISEQGSGTMPDMAKKEQERKASMTKGKPSARAATEHAIGS